MSDEVPLTAPVQPALPQEPLTPTAETSLPGITVSEPNVEQVHAAEAVFAQEQEYHLISGVVGMWTGTLLLHDLFVEHLSRSTDNEDSEEIKKKKEED